MLVRNVRGGMFGALGIVWRLCIAVVGLEGVGCGVEWK
jgi:hypothetical protein